MACWLVAHWFAVSVYVIHYDVDREGLLVMMWIIGWRRAFCAYLSICAIYVLVIQWGFIGIGNVQHCVDTLPVCAVKPLILFVKDCDWYVFLPTWLLIVDWHARITQCGHNASLTILGGGLADQIIIWPQYVLGAYTPVLSRGQSAIRSPKMEAAERTRWS